MKNKKPNAEQVWKQIEDVVVPRAHLSATDRLVYSHLLRHSRLEGKVRMRFSIDWLARGARITEKPARYAVRRLVARGFLRLVERSKAGHTVEVRVPAEIPALGVHEIPTRSLGPTRNTSLEELNFLKHRALRLAIHAREGGRCFYCRGRLTPATRCLDHVVPRVELEDNSYRNLVSCCVECNSLKKGRTAADFLRLLQRERRLTTAELKAGFRTLDALVAGKLRPPLPSLGHTGNHR